MPESGRVLKGSIPHSIFNIRYSIFRTEVALKSMFITWTSGAVSVALVVLCLWAWQHAGDFSVETSRPDVATLAVRSAAVAMAAAAQILLLTLVIGRFYRRQLIDDVLK